MIALYIIGVFVTLMVCLSGARKSMSEIRIHRVPKENEDKRTTTIRKLMTDVKDRHIVATILTVSVCLYSLAWVYFVPRLLVRKVYREVKEKENEKDE